MDPSLWAHLLGGLANDWLIVFHDPLLPPLLHEGLKADDALHNHSLSSHPCETSDASLHGHPLLRGAFGCIADAAHSGLRI